MSRETKGFKTESEHPIETMSFEDYAEVHHEHPYVFELQKGDKKLVYFGAKHLNDPSDPMFERIEEKMRATQPQLVFVEGIKNFDENVKGREDEFAKYLQGFSREEIIKRYGESFFTLKIAVEIGAKLDSPEPRYEDQIENLLKLGLDRESIFAYFIYRELTPHNTMDRSKMEEYLVGKIEEFKKYSNWDGFDYSVRNLEAIGRKIWGEKGDILKSEFSYERTDPTPWQDAKDQQTSVNEVSRRVNVFRDRYMVQRIKEALKDNDRIFIVFGASHAVIQEGAIRRLFTEF